jgi:hypothetical protein
MNVKFILLYIIKAMYIKYTNIHFLNMSLEWVYKTPEYLRPGPLQGKARQKWGNKLLPSPGPS